MPDWSTRVTQEGRSLARLLSVCLTLASREPRLLPEALHLISRIRRLHLTEAGALGHFRRLAEERPTPERELRRLRADHHQFDPEAEGALRRLLKGARDHDLRLEVETMETAEALLEDRTCIRETLFGMLRAGARHDLAGFADDARHVLDMLDPLAPRFAEAETRLRARAAAQRPAPMSIGSNGVV